MMLLFALIFVPLFLVGSGVLSLGVIGLVLTSGLFFLFIFTVVVLGQVIELMKQFIRRACAIEGLGVMASIRTGFRMVRGQLKEAGLIWLVLLGVNIVWPLALGLSAILLVAVAIVVGGGLGLLSALTAGVFGAASAPVAGLVVGIPIFLLVLILPLLLLDGLREVFVSSTWTLTYREFQSIESLTGLPDLEMPAPDQDSNEPLEGAASPA
jgi:hypothetical protein